ncbi:MAG: hypothetical protein JSW50_02280 [Candidatus Latescibacterota bacterium]|nr:MAG: hypothetical protein JSW50_02280 [Candidatus Latescibacterota bacterium]
MTQPAKHSDYALFAAVLLCVASSFFMMDFVPDDSYISFRYAENLANGHGLRFNTTDPPVEGYSNLLWILLCAVVYLAGLNLPYAMPTVGVLLGIFNILLLWQLLRRRGLSVLQMLFPLLILASSGPFILYVVSGMETPLFAFLLLLTLLWLDGVYATGRLVYSIAAAVTGVLLALCRPEGILVFPVVAAVVGLTGRQARSSRSSLRNTLIAFAVFVVLMTVYHWWRVGYFGELVPTPLLSKAGGGKSLWYAWIVNLKYYFVKQARYYPPVGYYFVALLVFAVIGVRHAKSAIALRQTELTAVILASVYTLIYFNFRDWMPGMRYNSAFVGVALLPAAHLTTRFVVSSSSKRLIWTIGLTAVVLNLGVLAQLRMIAKRIELSSQVCTVPLGKWLKEVMPPESLVAVSDVGAIPYYSGLTTLDFHPESLTDLHIAKNGFTVDYIRERDPDAVIFTSQSLFAAKFYPEHYEMTKDRRFDKFRFVGVSRYDWDNDRCYWVYIKSELPELTDEQLERFPYGMGSVVRR